MIKKDIKCERNKLLYKVIVPASKAEEASYSKKPTIRNNIQDRNMEDS